MDLFKLLASLTLDTSNYKKQMNNALDDAETFAENLKKILAGGAKLFIDTKEFKKSLGSAKNDASNETKSLGSLIKSGLSAAASAASGAVKGAFDKLPPGLQVAAKAVSAVVKGVIETIKEVGSFAAKIMSGVSKTVGAVAKPIAATVKATAKVVTDTVSATVKAVSASVKTIGKVVAAGIAAIGTGVVAVSKKSLDAYANYEQLVGGVDTLFKDSSKLVQQYAANAYKTAGLSANQYMETVTGFSASLLQSVGNDTKKAAKLADMAIIDMSDNANKMGTSMESIQNAYQGFAKQNYTMLDNLKLGYGGTKSEMERLLADAEKLTGKKYDISSYADIVEAIHAVQTEMGITGTTAEEANKTISGSINATKAAWENLLVGIADDNADVGQLVDNFVTSLTAAAKNLIPRVKIILKGAITLIQELAKELIPLVVQVIGENLPVLAESAVSILKTIGDVIKSNLDVLLGAAYNVISTLANGLLDAMSDLIPVVTSIIITIAKKLTNQNALRSLIDSAKDMFFAIISGLTEVLPELATVALQIVDFLAKSLENSNVLSRLVDTCKVVILTLVDTLIKATPQLVPVAVDLIMTIADGIISSLGLILDSAVEIIEKLVYGLLKEDSLQKLVKSAVKIVTEIALFLSRNAKLLIDVAMDLINALVEGLTEPNTLSELFAATIDIIGELVDGLMDNLPDLLAAAWDLAKALAQAIIDYDWWGLAKSIFSSIKGGIKKLLTGESDDTDALNTIPNQPRGHGVKMAKGGIVTRPIIAGEAGAEAIIPLEHNTEWTKSVAKQIELSTAGGESVKLMQQMLEEMRAVRQDMFDIILSALRTNADGFNVSEKDMARLVKKYAFA